MPVRVPEPLARADFQQVQAVFTDVDGTLTSSGLIESGTLRALEQLREAGVRVVLVSGRPAGWGECWMRTYPVDGVILENGGLYFTRRNGQIHKAYAQPTAIRRRARARLEREITAVLKRVRGARLSTESIYREVDIAIDYNEEVQLGGEAATQIETFLRGRGVQAVRSSVHVNCWVGSFDKLSAVKRYCKDEWTLSVREGGERRIVYVGDSFNDAPMFGALTLSIGVANVRSVLADIEHAPAYVTRSPEGRGFREVVRAVLRARGNRAVG